MLWHNTLTELPMLQWLLGLQMCLAAIFLLYARATTLALSVQAQDDVTSGLGALDLAAIGSMQPALDKEERLAQNAAPSRYSMAMHEGIHDIVH